MSTPNAANLYMCGHIYPHAHAYIIKMYQQMHQSSTGLISVMHERPLSKIECLLTNINIRLVIKTVLKMLEAN